MPPHLIYGPTAAVLAVTTALVATVCAVRPTRGLVTVTAATAADLLYCASVAAAEGIASMWAHHVSIGG